MGFKNGIHLKKNVITIGLIIFDAIVLNFSYFIALWFRFDCVFSEIPVKYLDAYIHFSPIYTVVSILIFAVCKMYRSVWRFAGHEELLRAILGAVLTTLVQIVGITLLFERMPRSYYLIGSVLQAGLTIGIRFSYRVFLAMNTNRKKNLASQSDRIMIVGAGLAGQSLIHDIQYGKRQNGGVCCLIDDNKHKWGLDIAGIRVVGGRDKIAENVKKYNIDKIYIAIPSASLSNRKDIISICNETGCKVKTLPGMYQIINEEVTVSTLKDVSITDLLGREPVNTELPEIFQFISGKVILVTGGGGSIGSELCRQIASHHPKQLIIFDIYENNAYDIQNELVDKYPDLNLTTLIGSVRDSRRVNYVFENYKPDIVFHAAAHKHVPLMEFSPAEAIKNNAIGTYKTAYAALTYGCKRFVLISTDKAVNPTNIMGASKRICEMIIQAFDAKVKAGRIQDLPRLFTHLSNDNEIDVKAPDNASTEFVAVRFGNVLGSNGSVIPLFKKQIEAGGPVTVTHPDIIRYFMTIPEAVFLILQAATYAKGGEIFVLDMGSPMKIDDLARNMIRLSGLQPDVDIKIEYIGLRPGEKLYEEKLMSEEGMRTTKNKLIQIGRPISMDYDIFLKDLALLMQTSYTNPEKVQSMVEQMVPTYHPSK